MTRFRRPLLPFATLALLAALCVRDPSPADEPKQSAPAAQPPKLAEQFRKPIAMAWVEPGSVVAVANGGSGTISLVDVSARRVVGETKVGESLTDLARTGDSEFFAALDDKTHEILLLKITPAAMEIIGRLRISDDPRRVVVAPDGRTAVVTCGWSRRVDVVELRPEAGSRDPANWNRAFPRLLRSIALPFAPQELAFAPFHPDERFGDEDSLQVVAADAFGGRLAVVDAGAGKVVIEKKIEVRNIRGMFIDDEHRALFVACQRSDASPPTTAENLRAGKLAANVIVGILLDELLDRAADAPKLDREDALTRLDVDRDTGAALGAADPGNLLRTSNGSIAVLLSGTNQLEVVVHGHPIFTRYDVGARPTALLYHSPRFAPEMFVVANSLDDTLSLIEDTVTSISLGPRPELWPRDRGERLFFDGRRSLGGFMSCHSCHTDGHTPGGLADTLGDGTYGTPKRIPTLLGTSITDPWGWNGGLRELRDQVDQSMKNSMHDPHYRAGDADDLTAYLHTLKFPPPFIPKPSDEADERLVAAGRAIFERERCAECHVGPLTFTSPAVYDVGLHDERGLVKFNPPSLRGVGRGVAFFHDARAHTLEQLFREQRHQLEGPLSPEELRALVRYLQGL